MRVLFTCMAYTGHIHPIAPFARALEGAGHEVAVATHEALAPQVAAAGLRPRLLSVGGPTLYLWFADRIAIGAGTWSINPALTVPWRPFGLPLEEAVFFLCTNLVLVNGLLLTTDQPMWDRVARLRRREVVRA